MLDVNETQCFISRQPHSVNELVWSTNSFSYYTDSRDSQNQSHPPLEELLSKTDSMLLPLFRQQPKLMEETGILKEN